MKTKTIKGDQYKRKDKKLKPFTAWVIKHKKANHSVVNKIFYTKIDALDDFNKMPSYDYDGCGKRDDYEIVKVIVKLNRRIKELEEIRLIGEQELNLLIDREFELNVKDLTHDFWDKGWYKLCSPEMEMLVKYIVKLTLDKLKQKLKEIEE